MCSARQRPALVFIVFGLWNNPSRRLWQRRERRELKRCLPISFASFLLLASRLSLRRVSFSLNSHSAVPLEKLQSFLPSGLLVHRELSTGIPPFNVKFVQFIRNLNNFRAELLERPGTPLRYSIGGPPF